MRQTTPTPSSARFARSLPFAPACNLFCEVVATFVLVYAVLRLSEPSFPFPTPTGSLAEEVKVGLGSIGFLRVGLIVFAIGLSLGGTTGDAINPARDLGPRIAHAVLPIRGKRDSDWSYAWIPVVGPIVGGLLVQCCTCLADCSRLELGTGERRTAPPSACPMGQRCEEFSLSYTSTKSPASESGASPKTHSLALCACMAMICAMKNASQRCRWGRGWAVEKFGFDSWFHSSGICFGRATLLRSRSRGSPRDAPPAWLGGSLALPDASPWRGHKESRGECGS